MASRFDTLDLGIFFDTDDFAVSVKATTWGKTIPAIFEENQVDYEDMTRTATYILVKESDVPTTAASGDLFTIDGTGYKLIDIYIDQPGLKRVELGRT